MSIDGRPARLWIDNFLRGLPFYGSPIHLEFLPALTAHRGALLSKGGRGRPVYAASFLRERRVVLEDSLTRDPPRLRLIFTHEVLHFAWWRLGNTRRTDFGALLTEECAARPRGELGESSLVAKDAYLSGSGEGKPRLWRDYVCESFCDTGAWLFSGVEDHDSFQLAARWKSRRAAWFRSLPELRV